MASATKAPGGAPERSFIEWVYETCQDQLALPEVEGSRQFHKFIESADISSFALSGSRRVQRFHILKFGYPMRRAGYTIAVFTAHVFVSEGSAERRETVYAYAYWPRDHSGECPAPEYVCISPSFESRDGEYRHRFTWFQQFLEGYESMADLLEPIEEAMLDAQEDDELRTDPAFFPENGAFSGPANYCRERRLGTKLLVAALAMDTQASRHNTLQNHVSSGYVAVLEVLLRRRSKAFAEWGFDSRYRASAFETGLECRPHRAQCGQKVIPLTIRESLQVDDINYAPWREVWVSRRVSDLVVNFVAPNFPIFNNWTFLSGTDESLFENAAMRSRFDRSAAAQASNASLRAAREALSENVDTDYRTAQLDAHIFDAIAYAQEFVLLTKLSLCTTGEYVGLTVKSYPEIIAKENLTSPAGLRMFANPAMQARYIFDLCYGAHSLHTVTGAIHADLHLNNMTIFDSLGIQYESTPTADDISFAERYTNPAIAYVAGPRGEADTYVFPHDGWVATLIDFSRAILGPATRAQIVEESGEAFAEGFFRGQVSRALRVLHHYIPTFVVKHQSALKGLLLAKPIAMFRAMTAVDFLAIGRNYGAHLAEIRGRPRGPHDVRDIEVAPEGIALAARIEGLALEHLISGLTDMLGEDRGGGKQDRPHAGDVVIPAAFAEYSYAAWTAADSAAADSAAAESAPADSASADSASPLPFALRDATLASVYNIAAPMAYSSSDYEKFPPWARFEDLSPHLGKIPIGAVTSDRSERPFLRSLELDGYLDVLQEQVRRGLSDAPAAATSSWIAE